MGLGELAAWQWRDYPQYHQSRANLLVHIVAVPLFLLGNVTGVAALPVLSWQLAAGGLLLSGLAFAAQGIGHKGEPVPPVPFRGPANLVARMFIEQWLTFPRFVLSGQWKENLRRSQVPVGAPR